MESEITRMLQDSVSISEQASSSLQDASQIKHNFSVAPVSVTNKKTRMSKTICIAQDESSTNNPEDLREACGVFGCVLAKSGTKNNSNLGFTNGYQLENQNKEEGYMSMRTDSLSADSSPCTSSNEEGDSYIQSIDVAKVIVTGLVALQHRLVYLKYK